MEFLSANDWFEMESFLIFHFFLFEYPDTVLNKKSVGLNIFEIVEYKKNLISSGQDMWKIYENYIKKIVQKMWKRFESIRKILEK